jgi:hypothetical protein
MPETPVISGHFLIVEGVRYETDSSQGVSRAMAVCLLGGFLASSFWRLDLAY